MLRLLHSEKIPKWIKIITLVLTILTVAYWAAWLVFVFLKYLRVFLHWATDSKNWWTFIVCILILVIGSLAIAQFMLGLNPFGNFINWVTDRFNDLRLWFAGLIGGA